MDTLLITEGIEHMGATVLDCWRVGGGHRLVNPPIMPYFYSKRPMEGGVPVVKRLLSNITMPTRVYKRTFHSTQTLRWKRTSETFEDNLPFNQRVAIDVGFKMLNELTPTTLAWDVETTGATLRPNPQTDRLKTIAVWGEKCKEYKDCLYEDCPVYKCGACDRDNGRIKKVWNIANYTLSDMLKDFFKTINKINPDIITGFNDAFYDWPVIFSECNRTCVRPSIARNGGIPYVTTRKYEIRGKWRQTDTIFMAGRICFDVFKEVWGDQALFNMQDAKTGEVLKTRGLNDCSRHFGLNPITDVNHANIPDDRVDEVNLDDARCTFDLSQIYLRNLTYLASKLSVPLNMIVHRSPSHIGNYIIGREYYDMGIVSDSINADRFKAIFEVGKGGKAYQGAYVKSFKRGIFFNVTHNDFTSFYPSIMIAFNLSPETVTLVEIQQYTGKYNFVDCGEYATIEVPDRVINAKGEVLWERQVICKVMLNVQGVAVKILKEILAERVELKEKSNNPNVSDEEKASLQSQHWGLKVVMNALYGVNGMRYSRYGNILVALLVTGIGRYIISNTIKNYDPIELDSDGFWAVGGIKKL